MWPSKQKPIYFTPSGISKNTDLKYSVTKTRPQLCIVLTCWAAKYLVIYILVFIIANLLYLWWLNFKVLLPSLSAISIDNRGVGGIGSGVGWGRTGWGGVGGVGGGKNHPLGHHMSSHDVLTVANNTPVDHTSSGSKYRSPLSNGALYVSNCSSCDSGGSAKCPW